MKKNNLVHIIFQREKCIGCNYCVEYAPQRWAMSKKDGKSVLLDSVNNKGFWSVHVSSEEKAANLRAAKACPVKIIRIQ